MSSKLLQHVFGDDQAWNKNNMNKFREFYSEIFLREYSNGQSETPLRSLLSFTQDEMIDWISQCHVPLDSEGLLKECIAKYRQFMRRCFAKKGISLGKFVWKSELVDAHNSAVIEAVLLLEDYIKRNPNSSFEDLREELPVHTQQEYDWLIKVNDFNRTEFIECVANDTLNQFRDTLVMVYGKLFDARTISDNLDNDCLLHCYDDSEMKEYIEDQAAYRLQTFKSFFPGMESQKVDNGDYKEVHTSVQSVRNLLKRVGECVQMKNKEHRELNTQRTETQPNR